MEKFYLGLDIGTNSVGLACTDENYNLLRTGGNDMLSVRLFDEANPAKDRRVKRAARRRLMRRQQRIDFLQEVFAPYIKDKTFFIRLNNSAFYLEDKNPQIVGKFTLFNDKGYTDKDFYKQFPTIFHLRRDLIKGEPNADLRLYYLAIHHAVKYRGHFLWEGEATGGISLYPLIETYNLVCEELFEEDVPVLAIDKCNDLKNIVLDNEKRINDKKREIFELFNATSLRLKEVLTLIVGGSAKPNVLFGEEYKQEKSFKFSKLSDDEFSAMQETYGDLFALLEKLRDIYNYFTFEKILAGNENISQAMVSIYDEHASDLKKFKAFIKENYGLDTYKKIFKSNVENGYSSYIGYTKPQKKKIKVKKCKTEDFYKFIKKELESKQVVNETEKQYWINKIENGEFLPKIIHADNGLFPHQVNLAEVDAILKNLAKDYPEFAIKDETGYSLCEKIRKIFLFKIPYYVGPLNTSSQFSWVVRKPERITPWNFDEVIDKPKTTEGFIRRMTNKCSYLIGKDVLPKFSPIYQRYNVLNQLNKLRINEQPISVDLKQQIFIDLFLKYPRITDKKIIDYLVSIGLLTQEEAKNTTLTGKDGDFSATMSSFITFNKIVGGFVYEQPEFVEDVVLWHTLNTDKNIVEKLILDKYGSHAIVKEKIKTLKGLTNFKEFATLSKEFLTEVQGGVNDVTGEVYTILGELWNTNKNLNEILNGSEYSFLSAIDEINGVQNTEVKYEDVENLYVSPQVRRGIWQAIQMVDECVERVDRAPDKIFIEVTRGDGEKGKRTVSRKRRIEELYKTARVSEDLINELNHKTDADLRSERLYLYFMQLGRCAYSGKIINLEELGSDMYDVDHIFPRSIIKDDSLDNKVLVLRTKNMEKLDTYPLPLGFTDQQTQWKILHEKGFMSDKKYHLLTRVTPLDERDFNEFINRQIVVTSQTNKAVANLLKRKFASQGTKIVFSKASNVSEFKQKFKIIKCRETNDFHHAHDAYLNVVVGNVYDTKFSNAHAYFHKVGDVWKEYSLKRLFHYNIPGAWNENSLAIALKNTTKTGVLVTRYAYEYKGAFYDETVYTKTDKGVNTPRKETFPYNQTEKYGGFKSLKTAYFVIVNSLDKKGNVIKTIESVPVLIDYKLKQNPNALTEFLIEKRGLKNPQIIRKLKIKTLMSINGTQVYLAGVSDENRILLHNAVQWKTNSETDEYVNALLKVSSWDKDKKLSPEELLQEEFVIKTNRFGDRNLVINKQNNIALYNQIIMQLNKPIYSGLGFAIGLVETLVKRKDDFTNLTTLNQVKTLIGCIGWLKCNATNADLSTLNESARAGTIRISKDITKKYVQIIAYSPCGFKKRIINV